MRHTVDTITDDELDRLYVELAANLAVLDRIASMVTAWEERLPPTISTATAVDAIRTVLERAQRGAAAIGSAPTASDGRERDLRGSRGPQQAREGG